MYDAIIIGAGLSGLSAAYCLKGFNTLILERENRIGGRVLTHCQDDVYYDLGAVLGYDSDYLPFSFTPPEALVENSLAGLFYNGSLHLGDSVLECVSAVFAEGSKELESILAFKSGSIGLEALSQKGRDIINAFFQGIHPGEIEAYRPCRQKDAFNRYRPKHYINGNSGMVEAFLERISAQIETRAEALSVEETKPWARVRFRQNGNTREVQARAVIVCTPAPIAGRLLSGLSEKCIRFLDSVLYGRFTVVALATRNLSLDGFSYIVTPQLPMTTIYKIEIPHREMKVLLFYYCDKAAKENDHLSDRKLIAQAADCLRRIGLDLPENDIVFTDLCRWDHGGTIISPGSYAAWCSECLNPAPGIFLAGDYLFREFPYGIEPAVRSGIEAAQRVRAFL